MPSLTFEIYLPIATVSEANQREHWAKKAARAKAQRAQAYLLTFGLRRMLLPATVRLTRISPRELDDDNLRGAIKAVRDGIADRLGINDRDPRVKWEYGQEKGRPKQRGVQVTAATDIPF
tara:strand:+ start:582 stop:941 length:360 start_codon:yes stop_codon:yes gene_type:complete